MMNGNKYYILDNMDLDRETREEIEMILNNDEDLQTRYIEYCIFR